MRHNFFQYVAGSAIAGMLALIPGEMVAAQTSKPFENLEPPLRLAQATQPTSPEDLMLEVELTDEQAQQLEAIFAAYQPDINQAEADLEEALIGFYDILLPETPDADIRVQRQKVIIADRTLSDLLFERNMAIRNVLTIDQRSDINQLIRDVLENY
jgi:Spy/CpxP family protein refolding chaperone